MIWRQEKAKKERDLKNERRKMEYDEYRERQDEHEYGDDFRRSKFNVSNNEIDDEVEIEEFKHINKFTLIGATTKVGLLSGPFVDRFDIKLRLDLYNDNDLSKIVERTAGLLNIDIFENASRKKIARCSRGTPRVANGLVKRIRDFSMVRLKRITDIRISLQDVEYALKSMGIDNMGLQKMDIRILQTIANDHNGGPVGANNIAVTIGEDQRTLEEYYEPYLIYLGLMKREGKGRFTTEKAYKLSQYGLKRPVGTTDSNYSTNKHKNDNEDNIVEPKEIPYKMR